MAVLPACSRSTVSADAREFVASDASRGRCGNRTCERGETATACSEDCPPGCGDRSCRGGETPISCPTDCEDKCGNMICGIDESPARCPSDCSSACGNGFCDSGESCVSCPRDCICICGNDTCDSGETAASCPQECPAVCNDGVCTGDETTERCPADCPPGCDDGKCDASESPSTCPADCPATCNDGLCNGDERPSSCPNDCPPVCNDGSCDGTESPLNCAPDCAPECGDAQCTGNETHARCPSDCPPPEHITLFLNMDGLSGEDALTCGEVFDATRNQVAGELCQFAVGDQPPLNTAGFCPSVFPLPPVPFGECKQQIAHAVRNLLVGWSVTVVTERPATSPYTMIIVRDGSGPNFGVTTGMSAYQCNVLHDRAVGVVWGTSVYALAVSSLTCATVTSSVLARIIVHEFGHTVGLPHNNAFLPPGIMAPASPSLCSADWTCSGPVDDSSDSCPLQVAVDPHCSTEYLNFHLPRP